MRRVQPGSWARASARLGRTGIAFAALAGAAGSTAQAQCPAAFTTVHSDGPVAAQGPLQFQRPSLGDLDHDGQADLAYVDAGGNLQILLGNGLGWFPLNVRVLLNGSTIGLTVADLNGDGRNDVVTAGSAGLPASGWFDVRLSSSTSPPGVVSLGAPVRYLFGPGFPSGISVGDVNGDGLPDLTSVVSQGTTSDDVVVFTNSGAGVFASAGRFPIGVQLASSFAVGDVTGDGRADVVVHGSLAGARSMRVLVSQSTGPLLSAPVVTPLTAQAAFPRLADFNQDGKLDVYGPVGSPVTGVYVMRAGSSGALVQPVEHPCGPVTSIGFVAGDFSGDGRPDVVVARSDGLNILYGNAAGWLDPVVALGGATGVTSPAACVGDINGDARPDIALLESPSAAPQIAAHLNSGAAPAISDQPDPVTACPNVPVAFSVTASGGSLTYRWQRETAPGSGAFVNLINGTSASWDGGAGDVLVFGATTDTLLLAPNLSSGGRLGAAHALRYRCLVTNTCGSLTSLPAVLALWPTCNLADISTIGGTPEAPLCGDGQITVDDTIVFVGTFSNGEGCPGPIRCSAADVCGLGGPPEPPDGQLTVDDVIAFVNAFSDGC